MISDITRSREAPTTVYTRLCHLINPPIVAQFVENVIRQSTYLRFADNVDVCLVKMFQLKIYFRIFYVKFYTL